MQSHEWTLCGLGIAIRELRTAQVKLEGTGQRGRIDAALGLLLEVRAELADAEAAAVNA